MGFYSMVAFFQKGGVFMYPILLVFAVGVAIAVERWVELNRIRSANQKMWDVLHPVLVEGEFDKAREMVSQGQIQSGANAEHGTGAPGCGAASRRHRNRHGREHDGDHPAAGEAHALRGAASPTSPPCSGCSAPSWV